MNVGGIGVLAEMSIARNVIECCNRMLLEDERRRPIPAGHEVGKDVTLKDFVVQEAVM